VAYYYPWLANTQAIGDAALGMNVTWPGYYYDNPMYRDLVKAGYGMRETTTDNPITVNATDGWPEEDFSLGCQWFETTGSARDVYVKFTGQCDTLTFYIAGPSVSSQVYDSGTNTTTATISIPANFGSGNGNYLFIKFVNTKRTNISAVNTGVTNVQVARPGYTIADLNAALVTIEFAAHVAPFDTLRWMDFQQTNTRRTDWSNDGLGPVTWSERPTPENCKTSESTAGGVTSPSNKWGRPVEDIITISNELGKNAWVHIPLGANDDYVTQLATLLYNGLTGGQAVYFELCNELWNNSFNQTYRMRDLAAIELNGFYGNEFDVSPREISSASRTSNVLTLTTSAAHGLTNGATIYLNGFGESEAAKTITYIDTTSFSVPNTGADGTPTPGGNEWYIANLNTTLRYQTTFAGDSYVSFYGLTFRWMLRRLKEISDLVRAVVGDANMNTRFRVVVADQMIDNSGTDQLDYVQTKWTARAVNAYFYGIAGAPYFFVTPYQNSYTATLQNLVDAATTNCQQAKTDYRFEKRAANARNYGLKALCYEGGIDSTLYDDGASDANRLLRTDMSFDSRIKQPIKDMLESWFNIGGDLFCWYNDNLDPTTNVSKYNFGVTNSYSNTTAPKYSALSETSSAIPAATGKHSAPGTIDGRGCWGVYAPYSGNYPNIGTYDYSETPTIRRNGWTVYCATSGTYALTTTYSCTSASYPADLYVSNSLVTSYTASSAGSHATTFTFGPTNITLSVGLNNIEFRTSSGPDDALRVVSLEIV
jgi:hypothetical protein